MARDPAKRPPSPVIVASNTALVTGILLIVVGLFTAKFLLIVGVFILAVSLGLTIVNRSQRGARIQDRKRPRS